MRGSKTGSTNFFFFFFFYHALNPSLRSVYLALKITATVFNVF